MVEKAFLSKIQNETPLKLITFNNTKTNIL